MRYADGDPRITCSLPIAEEAMRVNITPDATLAVVGHGDGTLRWYRHQNTGDSCQLILLVTAFITRTAQNAPTFVAWLPGGDFFNHILARDLVGWQVPGPDGRPTVLEFSKSLNWHKPEVVARALESQDPAGVERLLSAERRAELSRRAQSAALSVRTPVFGYKATDDAPVPKLRVRLAREGNGPWPKQLTVEAVAETSSGTLSQVTVRVEQGGNTYEPGAPIVFGRTSGLYEIDVHLPESVRRRNAVFQLCFYLDGQSQACHNVEWVGPIVPPPRPRLWAVFVGFSKYAASSLNTLKYPQNDALDMAHIFIDDHIRQSNSGLSPPDYRSVHVDLIVAPRTEDGRLELEAMRSTMPSLSITKRDASLAGIVSALSDIAAKNADGKLLDDVFLFYYSGHGMRNPYSRDKGLTLLTTPQMDPDASIAQSAFSSDVLIDWLNSIKAAKIVILDSCRVPPQVPNTAPFSGSAMTAEFDNRAVSAHVFFSADDGQYSYEQNEFSLERRRAEFGNSLFTYAFLTALNTPLAGATHSERVQVKIANVALQIDRAFDAGDPTSLIGKINAPRSMPNRIRQTPRYLPARTNANPLVVRSLPR